ncbi:transposase [Streptomyces cinereoruber]|uniref:transposase n=1 Tax=Streptomyces cinereoruber TaxID=67260 RepID=UPI003EC14BC1
MKAPGESQWTTGCTCGGILYVLYNDICWQLLPMKVEFGSGQTCWRRLGRWHKRS